jgi:probable selenium-dependent hydroxylase accessory protein YqeC
MTLTLSRALELGDREIIGLAGGGGKTALMFALGRELSAAKKGVLLTTTTKIRDPEPSREFSLFLSKDLKELKQWVGENLGGDRSLVVAQEKLNNGKLAGIPPFWVDELFSIRDLNYIVVEADGAAGRPLKAPREGEPVLPQATTLLIPIVGIDALGCPLNEEQVFRARSAMKILEAGEGTIMDEGMIARLVAAMLANRPAGAKVIPFVNKVDLPDGVEKGKRLARVLLESIPGTIKRVLLGQALRSPAVEGIVTR